MANPHAGEVTVTVDGVPLTAKLTLGALAELEEALGEASLVSLVERFESGACSSRDVMALLVAGLRGGGWRGSREELLSADIAGGAVAAARCAALLLSRAFTPVAGHERV